MKIKNLSISFLLTLGMASVAFAELPMLQESFFVKIDKTQPQEEVFMLQTVLNELGYSVSQNADGDPLPATGILDASTTAAIKDFQKENDLKVTGGINTETIKTLNDLSAFVNKNQNSNDDMNADESNENKTIWQKIYSYVFKFFNIF